MKRICKKCGLEKELDLFARKSKDVYRHTCRECYNLKYWAATKSRREKYPEKYHDEKIKKQKIHDQKVTEIKKTTDAIKLKGCIYCGYNKFPECIHFHHLDPKIKEMKLGDAINNPGKKNSLENILRELDKCIVLCANCHMALHNGDIKI
jgi:hypothetical protein